MYKGKGMHHVGLGVGSQATMVEFYRGTLEFTEVFEEFENVWNAMPDVFRNNPHSFGGVIWQQEAGGVMLELIWMHVPTPRPVRKVKRYGDLGVNKMTIAVSDIEEFYNRFDGKIKFQAVPRSVDIPGLGEYNFVYGRDPEGNLIEFASWANSGAKDGFGGVSWLGISVTDLDRSLAFYQKYLGFDTVMAKPHELFSGQVDEVADASGTQVRSCLIANSKGGGMLELFEQLKPRGRSIPFNTYWGDYGYLELCLDYESHNLQDLERYYKEEGLESLHTAYCAEPLEVAEIWFMYIRDPDGIPVEFVCALPKE